MNIEQLAEFADKVLNLNDTFNATFNPRDEEQRNGNLKLAIMAGLKDAYNKGKHSWDPSLTITDNDIF